MFGSIQKSRPAGLVLACLFLTLLAAPLLAKGQVETVNAFAFGNSYDDAYTRALNDLKSQGLLLIGSVQVVDQWQRILPDGEGGFHWVWFVSLQGTILVGA